MFSLFTAKKRAGGFVPYPPAHPRRSAKELSGDADGGGFSSQRQSGTNAAHDQIRMVLECALNVRRQVPPIDVVSGKQPCLGVGRRNRTAIKKKLSKSSA
jgi:hypothetical protein